MKNVMTARDFLRNFVSGNCEKYRLGKDKKGGCLVKFDKKIVRGFNESQLKKMFYAYSVKMIPCDMDGFKFVYEF